VNRVALLASFACASAAIVGGYFMVPGESEKLAMLLRDGSEELALARANELFSNGARDPALLMQAFALNQLAGEHDRAAEIIDAYFQQRPDDVAAWRRASVAFEEAGRTDLLRNALENVVRLSGDPAAAGKLAAIYRFSGKDEDELRVLGTVAEGQLAEADAIRLARLLIARDRTDQAVTGLLAVDDRKPGLSDEGRTLLFTALLDHRDYATAVERALGWMGDEDRFPLRDIFVVYLLRAGAGDEAFRLATSHLATGDAKDTAALAQLLYDEGRYDLVGRLMRESLAEARELPAEKLDQYLSGMVATARWKGIGDRLFGELFRVVAASRSADVEASFMQAMYDQMGYSGVAPFRHAISPQLLSRRPVLAARLLFEERNQLGARRFLMATDLREQSETARVEWLALARQLLSPQELDAELAWRGRAGAIPPDMRAAVLAILGRDGLQSRSMVAWHGLFDAKRADIAAGRQSASRPGELRAGLELK